ncbi:ATP-binding protein [Planomonospora corallina]|uniref:histidine kinase n=1 Tax=Planomonospora corallina TaxID=1806052 RepID=A0ABV8HYT1_9ACTN
MGASGRNRIDDPARLQALHATGLLAAPAAPVLDRVTRLAVRLLEAPASTVSLITADRQVVVSAAGTAGPRITRESPLTRSLYRHVVTDGAPLVIGDTRADERWRALAENAAGQPAACAAVPLNAPGAQVIGALCALDVTARDWSPEQVRALEDLAAVAEPEIALRTARAGTGTPASGEQEPVFLRALLDSLEVSVMACDEQGHLVINRPLRESLHTDTPPADVGSWLQAYRLYGPDGRTPLELEEMPLFRAWSGERFTGQQVVATTDAGPRRFLVNGRPIDAPGGHRLGAVIAGHDITDSHRIGVLHRAQQAVTRVLAEAASSREAAVGAVAAVTDALGWTYGEYWQVGEDEASITRVGAWSRPGRDLSVFTAGHPDVFGRGQELPGTAWERGAPVWIDDNAAARDFPRARDALRAGLRSAMALPVRSGDQVLGVLVFAADHSQEPDDDLVDLLDGVCAHIGRYMERRRAEELTLALAESRRRFEQVVSRVSDNVWSVEVAADGSLRSMYQSRTAALFGRPLPEDADVPGLIERRTHPDDRAAYASFLDTLRAGEPVDVEFRVQGLDGVTRWLWMRAAPRREGPRMFIDGISTDVTDRHELAEQRERLLLQQRQQMERLRQVDELKNQFLRTVNHELRTPLASVRSSVQLLHEGGMDAATQERFLQVLDRNSVRLEHLLNELLLMASLNAGDAAFTPAETELSALARQAVQAVTARGDTGHLTVTVHAPGAVTAWADAGRLRHALAQLLDNAVKFTPPGGRIDVTVTADPVPSIEVADTGVGIDPHDLPHVFDDFYRGAGAERQSIGGTGVGLALVRKIVRMHGGDVQVDSRPGAGTRIRLVLPDPATAEAATRRAPVR